MELLLGLVAGLVPIALIVLLIVYISKTNTISLKINLLERELHHLRQLEGDVAELKGKVPAQKQVAQPGAVERISEPQPAIHAASSFSVPQPQTVQQAAALPPPVSPSLHFPASPPSRTREEWEALIGGRLLNRIGAIALIIGVGFLLKYAFDNNWITETMRVGIGFAIGAGLLVGASRMHKKDFEVFAQGLVGAGLAVLYLSVFASFYFYRLVPQTVAFLMMSVVTMLAFLQAFKYDSLAVSLLGLLGGFLTPFLLSTGEANEVGLFTYIALLDAGVLAVLLMKDRWAILEPLSLGATYFIYLLWYKEYYTSGSLLPAVYFIIVFWVLFFALDVYRNLKSLASFKEIRMGVAAANALFFYVALYSLIEPEHHGMMGLVTLLIGVAYFGTAMFVQRKKVDATEAYFRQVLTAIVLLVLATAIEFTGFRTVQWWSVEALALMYCGVRWNYRFVWISGTVLFTFALIKLLYVPESFSASPVVDTGLLLNQRAFTFALLSASIAVGAFMVKKILEEPSRLVAKILDYAWPIIVFVLLTVETTGYFRVLMNSSPVDMLNGIEFKELMTLAVAWMMYSLLLVWSGIQWKVIPWQHVGLAVAMLSVCLAAMRGITYVSIQDFTLIANSRMLSMLVVLAGVVVHAHWMRNKTYLGSWNAEALSVVGVIIVLLLLDLITGETKDVFQKAKYLWEQESGYSEGSAELSRLLNLQQLSLSAVWLLYSVVLMVVGIWRRQRGIRISSIVLFGLTILKIFIYDLSFLQTPYRIFSFIGLGVILLAVSYLYQKYKDVILAEVKLAKANEGATNSSLSG
jgi:uncharacterized membrane protein